MDDSSAQPGINKFYDIAVKNLTYKVAVKSVKKGKKGKEAQPPKVLLNGVNAEAYHGQILAIVGQSGAGKSTFLDALAGRIDRSSVEGEIFVNQEVVDGSLKHISGYLMQDDALFPFLTVRETFLYSAFLCLPNSMTVADKKTRVESMLKRLGLEQCADTRVGNDKIRGVSGGERRRVSIGSDLIHDPAVMFLDEPTSGLDSRAALNVMQNLKNMTRSGVRTTLVTIHQPSYRMIDTIDRVLVLARGNVIYHGPPRGLKHYFDPLCRSLPNAVNVIEYAIDIIEDYNTSPTGLTPLLELQAATVKMDTMEDGRQGSPFMSPLHSTSMVEGYGSPSAAGGFSPYTPPRNRNKHVALDDVSAGGLSSPRTPSNYPRKQGMMDADAKWARRNNNGADYTVEYATSFLSEWMVLFNRNVKNTIRTPDLFGTRIMVMLFVGIVFGTLFIRLKVNAKGARLRVAVFAFIVAPLIFSTIEAMGVFIEERHIFQRERARKAYRPSSYVISGAAVSVPILLLLAVVLSITIYFIIGLVPTVENFLFFVLVIWLTLCMAHSFVSFFSCLVPNFAVGNTITTTLMSYFFLFSGFFIPKSAIPRYWIWLHYLSIAKYPYETLVQNEFGAKRFEHVTWGDRGTSADVARTMDISLGADQKWLNLACIIVFTIGYRILTWVALTYFSKSTRK